MDIIEKKPDREFSFDHAFWSHDGFTEDANGYFVPNPGSNYTDQKKVWELLGTGILENMWKGINSCAFAYG